MENTFIWIKKIEYILIIVLILSYIIKFKIELKKCSFREYNLKVYRITLYENIANICFKLILSLILISGLAIIFILINEYCIKQNLDIIKSYFKNNITTFNTILGAFLASMSGFLLHFYTGIKARKNEISMSCEALYTEIECASRKLEQMLSSINSEDEKKFEQDIYSIQKINYYSDWRKYYYVISSKLDYRYYEKIEELFTLVDNFNIALQEQDIKKMRRTFFNFKFWSSETTSSVDYFKIKPNSLLKNLNKYRKKKRINYDNLLMKIFIEKKVMDLINRKSDIIEEKIIEAMKQTGKDDCNLIHKIVIDWLKANDKEFIFLSRNTCERIVRESSSNFKMIKHIWGNYGFKDRNDKE